ncbi:uncharacterized protein LOC129749493 [Uranotaenia lowii]|uniref:uncharacterized protein LOC129749493 n=1 Tax=Uranotaenia lowii TaxID=190385 RepID=UPI002478363F|nr:uncharacterized protein LOC129749493 [Uranotaenia lowii]
MESSVGLAAVLGLFHILSASAVPVQASSIQVVSSLENDIEEDWNQEFGNQSAASEKVKANSEDHIEEKNFEISNQESSINFQVNVFLDEQKRSDQEQNQVNLTNEVQNSDSTLASTDTYKLTSHDAGQSGSTNVTELPEKTTELFFLIPLPPGMRNTEGKSPTCCRWKTT